MLVQGERGVIKHNYSWGDNIKAVTISVLKTAGTHNFVGNRSTMLKLSGIIRLFIDRKMGKIFQIKPCKKIFGFLLENKLKVDTTTYLFFFTSKSDSI